MDHQAPWWLLIFFPTLWLLVCTALGVLSGWYSLMRRYPDRPEEHASLRLSGQSGSMGLGVSMRGVLGLSTCPSGLRVSMNRLFGPFNRTFLVPWEQINATRKESFWWPRVVLKFGESFGRLTVEDYVANKLWRSIPERWPETGPVPGPERPIRSITIVAAQWLLIVVIASTFLLLVPLLAAPNKPPPRGLFIPVILFVTVVFGVRSVIQYARRR